MRAARKIALTGLLGSLLTLSAGGQASTTPNFTLGEQQPEARVELAGNTDGIYIVRLKEPSVAVYEGGINGYEATSARANGQSRLDTKGPKAKKYAKHLKDRQQQVLDSAQTKFGRTLQTRYDYQHAINGFALELSVEEAKAMGRMDGVVAVQRERLEYPTTDVGPQWINAPKIWKGGKHSSRGEGMVVAVLDSGINSDHPSFSAIGGDGYAVQNPLGSGNFLPGSYCDVVDPTFCNDKLIGAWDMTSVDGTVPEDDDGHGSHTASTAAGNVVLGARLETPTTAAEFDISGVAPHANIIAYDVCSETCPGAALVAAINQVLVDAGNLPDGIAALNYSISGGDNPYNDPVELGFLAAVEAGIYVAASAGNSGPGASTVAHLGPWVSTTAASTHDRTIANSLVNLSSAGDSLADLAGSSFSSGYGPATIIHANTIASDPAGQCLTPFPPGTFNGEIVMCDRGTIARTEKGENVLAGGAGGYILGNLGEGESTVADAHFLPAIHLGDTSATALRSWLATNSGTVGTITAAQISYDDANGDIMADFSSRGPQLAFDALKPDLTAPGVDIMGAEANGQSISSPEYQIISGTSMSSPHNAGAGALMTAINPDLTPTEIKSALMLTAITRGMLKEDGLTPTDPFDLGAGRIDLGRAKNAGLVMSESIDNFLNADPALGGDPSTLNIASLMNSNCVGTCSWTRTVTNKDKKRSEWVISATAEGFDVELSLDSTDGKTPKKHSKHKKYKKHHHSHDNSISFELKKNQSATFTVTVNNLQSDIGWQFGSIDISKGKKSKNGHKGKKGKKGSDMSMPIAVYASKSTDSSLFNKSVDLASVASGETLAYELSLTNGPLSGPITVSDVLPEGLSFVPGSESETVLGGVTTTPLAYDAGSNTVSWTGELDTSGLDVASIGNIFGHFPLSNLGILPSAFPANCDEGGLIVDVPAFSYNGQTYTQVIWSVNGTIEAGVASSQSTGFINQNLPDTEQPNNVIAPYWSDLNGCVGGSWSTAVLNNGPYSWAVFEWTDVPYWTPTNSDVEAASFQVWLLLDGSPAGLPEVHFTYGRLDNNTYATVGVENAAGTQGVSYYFDGNGVAPQINQDLSVLTLQGGSATLGFAVTTDCDENDLIVNEAVVAGNAQSETAIAVTECTD